MFPRDLTFEANWMIFNSLLSLIKFCSFPLSSLSVSYCSCAKLTLVNIIMARSTIITIRFSITIFLGVFLSPRAFLKSLITRLKEKFVLWVEDIDPDIDCWTLISPGKVYSLEWSSSISMLSLLYWIGMFVEVRMNLVAVWLRSLYFPIIMSLYMCILHHCD